MAKQSPQVSVVINANRLRGFQAPDLPADVLIPTTEPVVEMGSDEKKNEDVLGG